MKTTLLTIALCGFAFVLTGCGGPATQNIDMENDTGGAVMELDYRDFQDAASAMVQSLLQSGKLQKKDGSRYVVTTGQIINDTEQHIDKDQLMATIEEDLMNSGQVVMTSAVGGKGASDEMVYQMRDLKEGDRADEFKADTLPKKGQLVAPELSISGKILQRNISYNRKTQQVEYYFQLQVTEIASGLRFWQEQKLIGKRGSKKATPW